MGDSPGAGLPAAAGDMAPVEPPGDEGGRHAHGHTGEANGIPWGNLDELLWGSDDLWRDWGGRDRKRRGGEEGQSRREERELF